MPPRSSKSKSLPSRCKLCNNLDANGNPATLRDADSSRVSLWLNVDPQKLKRTPENGCRFCNVLLKALKGHVQEWRSLRTIEVHLVLGESIKVHSSVLSKEGAEQKIIQIYSPKGIGKFQFLRLGLLEWFKIAEDEATDRRPPWPSIGTSYPIPPRSDSEESFDFARTCIEECISSPKHTLCRTPSTYAPTRLIDVGEDDAGVIRLCELNGKHSVSYAALSHCWGTGPLLTTTSCTLKQHRDQIIWEALPRLFQDAVIVTRRLRLRFLWIDALCIIQDSREDWEIESAQMSEIYEGAYVTIAATICTNSDGAFLDDRPPKQKIKYSNTAGKTSLLIARETVEHYPTRKQGFCIDSSISIRGPLMKRAWALQEQVLCSRILYYTNTELIFECRTMVRCECTPSPKMFPTVPGLISRLSTRTSSSRTYGLWHHLVSDYTSRNLSRSEDKLPAISGIAHKFRAVTNGSYIAGLWLNNLADDMLWSTNLPQGDTSNERNHAALGFYRAPSFSWASIEGPIEFEPQDEDSSTTSLMELHEIHIIPTGLNPLGEISDGSLVLRGPVVDGELHVREVNSPAYLRIRGSERAVTVSLDAVLVEDTVGKDKTIRRARPGEGRKVLKAHVKCLGIRCSADDSISGLILGLSLRKEDYFERVGYFMCGGETFGSKTFQTIKLA